jgi:hypothetical protein
MRATTWIACVWPGLPRLWYRGEWPALVGAVLFAVLVNFALAASLIWPELLTPLTLWSVWLTVATVWAVSAGVSAWKLPELCGSGVNPDHDALFRQAQDDYLKADWFEAESKLGRLLNDNARDAEAHLMLVGLYRHTNRTEEARRQLQLLEQLDASESLRMEMEQERKLLDRRESQTSSNDPPDEHPLTIATNEAA